MKNDKKKIRLGILEKELPIEDMQVNVDPCYYIWKDYHVRHGIDCDRDCTACGPGVKRCAYGSDMYQKS